ncbi:hypothetical protein HK102_000847 [Quaeritorhiza haematococci]|nr:hypothetical protein HK102_000847 [Quaeritorhiza haematococci]
MEQKTLVYIGAGWDMKFLCYNFRVPHNLRVTTYVCLDALPLIPFYGRTQTATSQAEPSVVSCTQSVPALKNLPG